MRCFFHYSDRYKIYHWSGILRHELSNALRGILFSASRFASAIDSLIESSALTDSRSEHQANTSFNPEKSQSGMKLAVQEQIMMSDAPLRRSNLRRAGILLDGINELQMVSVNCSAASIRWYQRTAERLLLGGINELQRGFGITLPGNPERINRFIKCCPNCVGKLQSDRIGVFFQVAQMLGAGDGNNIAPPPQ